MEMVLTEREAEVLSLMIEKDIHELLREIANAEHREFREELKADLAALQGIKDKLTAVVGVA